MLSGIEGVVLLVAWITFGGVLAFTGLNHFLDGESMAGYAKAKGLPAPRLAVVLSGRTLVFGGLAIALGVLPLLGAGAIVLFLLVATPTMHNFWAAPEGQRQSEMTTFLKNVGLLAGALAFMLLASLPWPYALLA